MANTNYLDELDGLLDEPPNNSDGDSLLDIPVTKAIPTPTAKPLNIQASETAQEMTVTWAAVIENASDSLQDSARTVQDAIQKNLDLAKNQNESIKELVDAASGWRHSTRQAVQEVTSAKKNIIILTVISGVIALAGFGTTIGVMLQSRAGLATMSNSVLENVDEHQTLVSRTLTLKMDELASTIERMEATLDQMAPPIAASKEASVTTNDTPAQTAEGDVAPSEASNEVKPEPTPAPQIATTPPVAASAAVIPPIPVAPLISAQSQDMQDQLTQVTGQLSKLEQNWKQSDTILQKQLSLIPNAVDEKIAPRLQKITTGSATAVVTQDNKAVLEQLSRLRQDMAEIRQLQTSLKDQISQLKSQNKEAVPYQYRNPEVERYPR
jgi:hypothetical protein